ncbi:DUF550 domain-containing protein [Scatolibacter rhodanostii]|uniref:DUF550 domain-containing protein n=1 Tax=Scatolibacter rhodanostii TaxID=2014781 RepID=UPI000C07F585|nr:DUF550 domain-containing protein [Scatolibacter rhodanostii]
MKDINFSQMQEIQKHLWEQNQETWRPLTPTYARESFLWMMEETGEAISIIKKKGDNAIMEDDVVRRHFTEEIVDMMMYLNDVLMRYQVTPEEMATAYQEKYQRNLSRNFVKEHHDLFQDEKE